MRTPETKAEYELAMTERIEPLGVNIEVLVARYAMVEKDGRYAIVFMTGRSTLDCIGPEDPRISNYGFGIGRIVNKFEDLRWYPQSGWIVFGARKRIAHEIATIDRETETGWWYAFLEKCIETLQ
jgi:hypothetical protein